ncbi:unnamed protein product [Adineta steineri]|uniref:Uncharacterized protein n=1 Tax=Adineta steineri TaxID=433720 RepID=A0A816FM19_9BILA|nr:unnamed protein product [Adineta steineri]CAF1663090.1 unnamed protein product [Adineta steineri]
MWPILGPIEMDRSTNFHTFQHSLFDDKSRQNSKNNSSTPTIIISNIRYTDPISSPCLILYSLVLLLLCALPILALNIYIRQALSTFQQAN